MCLIFGSNSYRVLSIERAACRSILAGATSLVDSINASSGDAWTSVQCDNKAITVTVTVAANSHAA